MAQKKSCPVEMFLGSLSLKHKWSAKGWHWVSAFQLKGGSAAQWFGVVVVCFPFHYCGFFLAWGKKRKNLTEISKISEKIVPLIFHVIPCYWRSIKMQEGMFFAVQYGLRRLRWLSSCWWCVGTKKQLSLWVCCQTLLACFLNSRLCR